MADYDFHRIFGSYEFQDFVRDMIQVREGVIFESFSEGRDLGIDNRYVSENGETTVLQTKRWQQTASVSMSQLREEREKLDKISVDRYIIAFSRDISPPKKQEIMALFQPYIRNASDIIGQRDLNNYLAQADYFKVKEKYFKLWIQDTETLKSFLQQTVHSALLEASKLELEEAIEKAKIFVRTEVYDEAFKKLCANKTLIISGEPGVGKTTLANQLALYFYVRYGFHTIVWAKSVEDLYKVNQMDGKKVVVYDDFWGSNFFEGSGFGNQEQQLARFIELIHRKKDYYLILTTREYILEQGLKKNDDLRRIIGKYKLDCRVEAYSREAKLRIYLGHLQRGNLTWEQTRALLGIGRRITDSPNFNPRVIEMFAGNVPLDQDGDDCAEQLLHYLDHPNDFWGRIYENLSAEARLLYVIMVLLPSPVGLSVLMSRFHEVRNYMGNPQNWNSFPKVIAELEKTVIRTVSSGYAQERVLVSFQNPSAKDFIYGYVKGNFEQYRDVLIHNCAYYSQYIEFLRLLDGMAEDELYNKLMGIAITLIEGASILVPDVILEGLEDDEEEEPNYIFRSSYKNEEIGKGRWIQLLNLYDKNICLSCKDAVIDIFKALINDMIKSEAYILPQDLDGFLEIADKVVTDGIYHDKVQLLHLYVNCMMANRFRLDIELVRRVFRQEWETYFKDHYAYIICYIEKYYRAELCLAAAQGEFEGFLFAEEEYREDKKALGISEPLKVEHYLNLYDSWFKDVDFEDDDLELDVPNDYRSYEELEKAFRNDYLNVIQPRAIENVEEYVKQMDLSAETMAALTETFHDYKALHWRRFFENEDGVDFLLAIYECKGRLAKEIDRAVDDVFSYMRQMTGIEDNQLIAFFNGLAAQNANAQTHIWSEKQLDSCNEIFLMDQNWIRRLTDAKILIERGGWYAICDSMLFLFSEIRNINNLSTEARTECYGRYAAELWKNENILLNACYRIDRENFIRYILYPVVDNFYQELYDKEAQKIIERLVKLLDLRFKMYFDHIVIVTSYQSNDYLGIQEIINGDYVMRLIPEKFSPEQKDILKERGLYDVDAVNSLGLTELWEKGLLSVLGLEQGVLDIWEDIKKIRSDYGNDG